jgi:hypothetical protein
MEKHKGYAVPEEDLLYVASRFVLEPVHWNERFGWRKLCDQERLAFYFFWREVTRQLGVSSFPETYALLHEWSQKYELRYRHPAAINHELYLQIDRLWETYLIPGLKLPQVAFRCLMKEPVRRALMLDDPSRVVEWLVTTALRVRAQVLKVLPKRWLPIPAMAQAKKWSSKLEVLQ